MHGTTRIALLLSASVIGGGTLHAQGRDSVQAHQRMDHAPMHAMMPMMAMCPMRAAMVHGPETALDHADALALTESQRGRLQVLRDAMEQARDVLSPEQRARLHELHMRQAMDRMTHMMQMMSRMMEMMERDSTMGMPGMKPRQQ